MRWTGQVRAGSGGGADGVRVVRAVSRPCLAGVARGVGRTIAGGAGALVIAAGLLGCGTPPPAGGAPPGAVEHAGPVRTGLPDDLTIDCLVRVGPRRGEDHEGVQNRSRRYLLQPDGSLRVGDPAGLPPVRRVLSRPDMEAVWELLQDRGFRPAVGGSRPDGGRGAAGALAEPTGNPALLAPDGPAGAVIAVSGRSDGRTWWRVVRLSAQEAVPPAFADVIRMFARCAWEPDVPPDPRRIAPRRYEFGPDPYAWYESLRRSGVPERRPVPDSGPGTGDVHAPSGR